MLCFVGVPIMALTATAVPKVQKDIVSSLGMIRPLVSKATFDRPNLAISIQRKGQGMAKSLEKVVLTLKTRPTESTIVYCATTREVEEVAETIRMHLRDTKVVLRSLFFGIEHFYLWNLFTDPVVLQSPRVPQLKKLPS